MHIVQRSIASIVMVFAAGTASPALYAATALGCSSYQPATDANVFNWRFYLNANADLTMAGITTPEGACAHWLGSGLNEGRQAHAGFHTAQYLSRYSDLLAAFGVTGYASAVWHYVTYGISEGRTGYFEDGMASHGAWRTTVRGTAINGGQIYVSASRRNAGAVDSLMLNNIEFINAWDHGRELQIAVAVPPYGEGYNPTEAGSCQDGLSYGTTSVLGSATATTISQLATVNTPAFWHGPDGTCGSHQNATAVASNYVFHKNVQIGINGFPNVVEFSTAVDFLESLPLYPGYSFSYAIEAPTGYLGGEFNKIRSYNPTTMVETDLTADAATCERPGGAISCGHSNPVVFSTTDDATAMAVCTGYPSSGPFTAPSFGAYSFIDPSAPANSTTKWNISFALLSPVTAYSTYYFVSYMVVAQNSGTSTAVQVAENTIRSLYQLGICR